ncbi:Uncharacterized protein ChrSV_4924 [Chromobacterium vaccinii]|nr:Uncharacterized protein ChrSW_4918 [Chromobacterium vaccinii]QND92379.1 Uncharacterized protein ChrSV_4924 [Chromobacterium vaccinii]
MRHRALLSCKPLLRFSPNKHKAQRTIPFSQILPSIFPDGMKHPLHRQRRPSHDSPTISGGHLNVNGRSQICNARVTTCRSHPGAMLENRHAAPVPRRLRASMPSIRQWRPPCT